ncbi:MAG: hypothetical protein GEV05_29770 [Betaproteobacteria bacterium]|nr:hypothetical protein [Betaproteobacteria bacterium]
MQFNGWIGELAPEEAVTEARRWLKAGFKSAKIKVGSGVKADRDRIEAVPAAVGSAMKPRIDANLQYDADTSLRLCRMVKQFDLQLFEQPAHLRDLAGLARLATAEAAGLPVVIGHGFRLDPGTLAKIMLAATSRDVLPGLECVGPLKVTDTVATTRLDISSGSLPLLPGPGLGISLDENKLEQYRLK